MELYFNPYPGIASDLESGAKLVIGVADALHRLKDVSFLGHSVSDDVRFSDFILVREAGIVFRVQDIFSKITAADREKLRFLLTMFSKGRVIDSKDMINIEDWIVKNIGAAAPILEFAAKKNAVALTIPTKPEWCVDVIEFENREENLHNLWGQDDLSRLKDHCINALKNIKERFTARYDARFCGRAVEFAPPDYQWERAGFFQQMDKAKAREYDIDSNLIKAVDNTKYGLLRELRCVGEGWRIFFVFRNNASPQVLIGGFYKKNTRVTQTEAIVDACKRIDATNI